MNEDKVKHLFSDFMANLEKCNDQGIKKDGEILANLIILKYGGEDMLNVLKITYQNIYIRNHFLPHNISID